MLEIQAQRESVGVKEIWVHILEVCVLARVFNALDARAIELG